MYSTLLIGLALVAGAPGAKDPPKKDADLVGEWLTQTFTLGGMELPPPKDSELRFTFAAEGKMAVLDGKKKPEAGTYKIDAKKIPAEIDMNPPADSMDPPLKGIFKIDGDTLTLCLVEGKKGDRPTKFESTKDSPTILMTLKKVKK